MAGNKKTRRPGSSVKSAADRAAQSRHDRITAAIKVARQAEREEDTLRLLRNALPLGHAENAHKIDSVFAPLESLLSRIEKTGELEANDKGQYVIWDDQYREWLPIVPLLRNTCVVFEIIGEQFSWGVVQTAHLRRCANKWEFDSPLFQSDTDGMRADIAWLRAHVVEVSPNDWSDAIEIAEQREALTVVRVVDAPGDAA